MVILAETLLGKGLQLKIYDRSVSMARLVGANKRYIDEQIPHLASLLCETPGEVIADSDVIVVGNRSPEFSAALTRCTSEQTIVDLVRVPMAVSLAGYRGICW
jgi:GDP-mannose 6-dehydrogenase